MKKQIGIKKASPIVSKEKSIDKIIARRANEILVREGGPSSAIHYIISNRVNHLTIPMIEYILTVRYVNKASMIEDLEFEIQWKQELIKLLKKTKKTK